jgi:anti-sigma B factor antagonist
MKISKSIHNDYIVFLVEDEINMDTSKQLGQRISKEIDAGKQKIAVNLESTEYIDSTGLGTLISIHKRLQKMDSQLILVNIPENIMNLLILSKLINIFTICESLEKLGT